MATIQFRSDDAAFMHDLSTQLAQDLQRVGLEADVQLITPNEGEVTRGDPVTMSVIALSAVAAGGALTAFLGKGGGLSALAKSATCHPLPQNQARLSCSITGSLAAAEG